MQPLISSSYPAPLIPLQRAVAPQEQPTHLETFLYPGPVERLSHGHYGQASPSLTPSYRVAELDDDGAIPAGAPWIIRGLFGEGHWCTRWVLSLCAADRAFFQHMSEQAAGYIHYLCLVRLALLNQQPEDEIPIEELAPWIRNTPRKTILKQLYNPYPQGILKIITKLGRRPLSKNDYRRLIRLLSRDGCAQALRHMRHIKPYRLVWMEEFPTEYLHPKLLDSIYKGTDYQTLKYIFRTFDAFSNEKVPRQSFWIYTEYSESRAADKVVSTPIEEIIFSITPLGW